MVPRADVEPVAAKQRRGLERRALVAPALAPGLGVPRHDEAVGPVLALQALDPVHVRLVDESLADRRRRGGAAPEALAPADAPGLRVEREEEALLLGDVDPSVADAGRELDRVVGVDRPQALVGRPVLVGRDVLARVVVAVGRPRPRVVLLRAAASASGSSVVTNSSVAEPRFSIGSSWLRTYRPIATARTITTSPPPSSRRRRVTARRMADGLAASAADSMRQMRFVTSGTSRLSADSSSSRAHCGVPGRSTIPPPRPSATNAGWPASRPAAVIRRAPRGRLARGSNTVNSPTKLDMPSNSPSPSSNTVSGAGWCAAARCCSPKAFARRGLDGLRADLAAQRHRALERVGPERRHAAAVRHVVAQALHQLLAAATARCRRRPRRGRCRALGPRVARARDRS